jgi:hypothetical protein
MSGATGIWASVCIEGSSMGNAASCVTLMNLIRLGNKKVLKKYNCTYLRKAAINVTRITTGIKVITKLPNSEQSYKGKVKTHNYINRQNQSTTGKL